MASQHFVRADYVLSGRWQIDQTKIAFADMQSDYASHPLAADAPKRFQSLSPDTVSMYRFLPLHEWHCLL